MSTADVIVIGGGVSGMAFAFRAAAAGRSVKVLEREPRVGGCLYSPRRADGFWFEMGAHSAYNSYRGLLEIAEATGAAAEMVERGPSRARFGLLRAGHYRWLTPPKVLLQLNWVEAALHAPRSLFRGSREETLEAHFGGLVGPRNFREVVSPFLAAVPSQSADAFPFKGPGSLFKKRTRRKEFPGSFGFKGGLQTICEAVARQPRVAVELGVTVERLARTDTGFAVHGPEGRRWDAPVVAVAASIDRARTLLEPEFATVAASVGSIGNVVLQSCGLILPKEKAWLPECAFLVAAEDRFYSAVTRDPFPDAGSRAFTFHFRPGVSRAERLERIAAVLRLPEGDLPEVVEREVVLPSPTLGHAARVEAIDRSLAGSRMALTGNYFDGLAIEDCVQRSNSEWSRVGGS